MKSLFKKTQTKFETYKSDAAPFFFYIEIFPFDSSHLNNQYLGAVSKLIERNPIVPLPMRVDRVINGVNSVLIRPREAISFPVSEERLAVINPHQFLLHGIKNLIHFSEMRSSEYIFKSITNEKVKKWWNSTRYLYGNLYRLEEDFSAFLKAYLHTMVKCYIEKDDMVGAAIQYCQLIEDVCRKRMEQNSILVEMDGKQSNVKIYKEKDYNYYKKFKKVTELQVHPELIDIEVIDYSENEWSSNIMNREETMIMEKKYIPLLIYDDLQECMLQNLRRLEKNEDQILNPASLIKKNIISIIDSKDFDEEFKINNLWMKNFKEIDTDLILNEMFSSISK